MDYERTLSYLEQRGQEHLLKYYGELNEEERRILLEDIDHTNFSAVANLSLEQKKRGKLSPISAVTAEDIKRRYSQFESVGLDFLSQGKVAAVLLAGGQGSRLGFSGPKGMYNIGINRKLSIF